MTSASRGSCYRAGSRRAPGNGAAGQISHRLEALAEISRLVTSSLDPRVVLEAAAQATSRLLDVDETLLWLHDGEGNVLRLGAPEARRAAASDPTLSIENSLSGWVLRSRQPLVIGEVASHRLWQNRVPHAVAPRSGLFVPFYHQDRPLGVLVALSRQERVFDGQDVQLIQALAAQVAVAVQNARLYEEAQHQARQLAAVLDVNKRLALGPGLGEILSRIAEEAARLIGADGARLRLVEGDELVRVATYGPSEVLMAPDRVRADEGLSGRVVTEGQPIMSNDLAVDLRFAPMLREQAERHGMRSWLGVPLRVRERIAGTLSVVSKGTRRYSWSDVRPLEAFADQAAIAIENARVLATAQRRAEEAMAVAGVGRAITSSLDLQAVLELIVEQACRLLGTERSALAVVEPAGSDSIYRFRARRGLSDQFVERIRPRHSRDGTTARAVVERRPIWSADLLNDPAFELSAPTRAAVEAEGYRAVLSVPLLVGDRPLGALVVYRDSVGPFSSDEVDLLRVFADQAAIAIENVRLFQEEQARRKQLEAVRDVSAEIARELDLTALLELIMERSVVLVGSVSGTVFLWDEETELLVPRASRGQGDWINAARFRLGQGVTGAAAAGRQSVVVNDYRAWPQAVPLVLRHTKIAASMAEPILYQDRLIGVITVNRHQGQASFNDQDRELLGLFAGQAAIAIENARLFEQAATVEALRELARLKSEFLSTASHELRTPLWLIHGYAELLQRHAGRLPAEQLSSMAAQIKAGSTTMVRLVEDLLSFSRLEQGNFQLSPRRVRVAEILAPLVEGLRAQPGGERIEAKLPRGLEAELDPDRLTQVVSNLLVNALRYAPEGPIVLRAARRQGDLRLEVTDQGPGVPPAEQARIWERFYRGAEAVNSPNRGSGLGLALVKQLVELHGGRVGVSSVPGAGATFWVTFPTAPAAPAEQGTHQG